MLAGRNMQVLRQPRRHRQRSTTMAPPGDRRDLLGTDHLVPGWFKLHFAVNVMMYLPGVKGGEPQLDQSKLTAGSCTISASVFAGSEPSRPENMGFNGVASMSLVPFPGLLKELP